MTPTIRKTHPMVLTAAVAVTIFSLLGSAAITGLIPTVHSSREETTLQSDNFNGYSKESQDPNAYNTSPAADNGARHLANPSAAPANTIGHSVKTTTAAKPTEEKSVAACNTCGVIESIRLVQRDGEASGLGAVAGGVVGGVAGNQIGKGKGNTLMTILGMGGGAYAGHTIEKKIKTTSAYQVKIHMEDGTYRSVTQASQPEYAVGDHVKVLNGRLTSA